MGISETSNSSIGYQVGGQKRPHLARIADRRSNKRTSGAISDYFIPSGLATSLECLPQECLVQAQAQESFSHANLE
jgi:hypothetical protein